MKCLLIMMIAFLWSAPSFAAHGELELSAMFDEVCQEFDLPKPLLMAIAKLESALNPWSLNIQGRSHHFASKAEALARAQAAWVSGQSFDVGFMQVNRWWLVRYNIPLETALDPLANIYLGGWILKQELHRHKDLRKAIGAYHSPNPQRARRYADQVLKALEESPAPLSRQAKKAASTRSVPVAIRQPATVPAVSRTLKTTGPTSMKVKSK